MRKWLFILFPVLVLIVFSCDNTTGTLSIYTLETNVAPGEGGTISPSGGEYDEGSWIKLEAIPDENYLFERWEGDLNGVANPDSILMDRDRNITAVFLLKKYSLNIETEGDGSVSEEIVEDPVKSDYEHGTTVRLTAEPEKGWRFDRWEDDVEGSENPETITIVEAASVTAVFVEAEGGSDSGDSGGDGGGAGDDEKSDDDKSDGGKNGSEDDGKDDDEDHASGDDDKGNGHSDDDKGNDGKDDDKKDDDPKTEYSIKTEVEGKGVIWKEPDQDKYEEGTKVKIGANGLEDWEFSHWEKDFQGTTNPVEFEIDQNKDIRAVFKEKESEEEESEPESDPTPDPEEEEEATVYTLTINPPQNDNIKTGMIVVNGDPWNGEDFEFTAGTTVELKAHRGNVQRGLTSRFSHWEGIDQNREDNPVTVTIESDMNVYSVFDILLDDLQTSTRSGDGETGVGGEVVIHTEPEHEDGFKQGQSIEFEAVPDGDNWEFVEWDGNFTGTDNPITQDVYTANFPVVAVFKESEPETYTLTAMIPGGMNVFIDGSYANPDNPIEYEEGTTVEISANPVRPRDLIYLFSQWEGDGIQNLEDPQMNPTTVTMNSDVIIDPVFDGPYVELRDPRITGGEGEVVIHTPPETVDGGRELYLMGQEIEVEAIEGEGYKFVEWGLSFSGTDNPSIQTVGNTPGEAVFEKIDTEDDVLVQDQF